MRLQPLAMNYSGSYAKIRNTGEKAPFRYSIKVDGRGNTGNHKSLFNFGTVSITEHIVNDKYGTGVTNGPRIQAHTLGYSRSNKYDEIPEDKIKAVQLPESFDDLKECNEYYHGRMISEYEMIQTAVAAGKMELPENPKPGTAYTYAKEAFKVLVQDEARPKYAGSATLYSEDGRYTFTKDPNGNLKMHFIDDEGVGASLENISNWIMSGTPNRNIETRYLAYLRSADPELYDKAQHIGMEVRTYGFMEDLHEEGVLSDKQNTYDLGLLGMLFGKDPDGMRLLLHKCRTSGNYLNLLDMYDADGAERLKKIREEQLKRGGVV